MSDDAVSSQEAGYAVDRPGDASTGNEALSLLGVSKHFLGPRQRLWQARPRLAILKDVDLTLLRGRTLALVGESGSGKTTLARIAAGLLEADEGSLTVAGEAVEPRRWKNPDFRRRVQIVFQNPYSALNPRMSIYRLLVEPLEVHGLHAGNQQRVRVEELAELVGIEGGHLERYPREFSGGQRQRIAIARALAAEAEILILDEPVSALDVSVQAQILNLLVRLQQELSLTYLFVSHDLGVVQAVAHEVAVMHLGTIVEQGPTREVFDRAAHPYTHALLSSRPVRHPDHRGRTEKIVLSGDQPSPSDRPVGCTFASRCWLARERCLTDEPQLQAPGGRTQVVACHYPILD